MAEIPIQRKKTPLSPWLLVFMAAVALALGAYWYLRPAPVDEPSVLTEAPAAVVPAMPADSLGTGSAATMPGEAAADTSGARGNLLLLVPMLTELTDRADLRDDATIREQRDNLTSATARLTEGDVQTSLRPGMLATANLLRAVQQRAYPALEQQAAQLVQQAGTLSGRDATAAEQQQNQQFLQAAMSLLQAENVPPTA